MRRRAPRRPCCSSSQTADDLAGRFQAIQGRVERAFLELEQSAASELESMENFQAVGVAAFEGGQDQRFEMAAQLIAVNGSFMP